MDNVGDNVGDCAGMAADLFETYAAQFATMLLGGLLFSGTEAQCDYVSACIGCCSIVASVIGALFKS